MKKSMNPFISEKSKFLKITKELRKKIPDRYNKIDFIDELTNDDVSKIVSITSRSDGKTTNFFGLFSSIADCFDLTGLVITRHYELRSAMITQIFEAIEIFNDLDITKLGYKSNENYMLITYKKKILYIIVDLNNANDLKNYSSVLKKAQITIFDEFIDVFGYYSDNEYLKFKTIFETMDKNQIIEDNMKILGGYKKAIFMGNPSSKIEAITSDIIIGFDWLKILAKQPINTSTIYKDKNLYMERRQNENVQEQKNNRMFNEGGNNDSETGEFYFNEYLITQKDKNLDKLVIKTNQHYINVYYNSNISKVYISIKMFGNKYDYNTELSDIDEKSIYLDKSYYRDNFYKKYNRGYIKFNDVNAKHLMLNDYVKINIFKLIQKKINSTKIKKETLYFDAQEMEIKAYANKAITKMLY